MVTLDTNILVYYVDADAGERHASAVGLMRRFASAQGVLSQQVVGEFLNVARRSSHLDEDVIRTIAVELISTFPILPTPLDLLPEAFDLSRRHKLQYWDALILTVARANGVATLLTEDMQDGATIDGVLILDPFNPANRARLDALLPA
ncbi:PIN domain-containing protein [Sphingomonas lenta]|uniref:PIN domain-containing protein n=1 Tax=Sphingomonas lenta TaxID=1141887 RepID=UPI001594EEC1|nr:PIN domain-containing protein [Sphingomonas lenta]